MLIISNGDNFRGMANCDTRTDVMLVRASGILSKSTELFLFCFSLHHYNFSLIAEGYEFWDISVGCISDLTFPILLQTERKDISLGVLVSVLGANSWIAVQSI